MQKTPRAARRFTHRQISYTAALILLSAIGTTATLRARSAALPINIRGNVIGIVFTPPAGSAAPSTTSSYYRTAKVCLDADDNAKCDPGDASAMTDAGGQFFLRGTPAPLVAEITTLTLNNGQPVNKRMVFRTPVEAINEGTGGTGILAAATVMLSPLTTELSRMMATDHLSYLDAKQAMASRLGTQAGQLVTDFNKMADGPARRSLLQECVILTTRFSLAAKMVDRGDVSPAALKLNPSATSPAIGMKEAQEASMNLEDIPRYDHIFIIILENKPTASIRNSPFAPRITQWLSQNNQFTSYFSTGSPSEPNRIAVSSGDDWGVGDDSAWNCVPTGDTPNVVEEPLPAGLAACTTNATNHNLKKPNLFSAMTHNGMSWRLYSESQNPGRDWRLNGANDSTIVAPDHAYTASDPVGAIGNANLLLTFSGSLYQTKHNGTVNFQDVRSEWDFATSNRTLGGGQWDDALRAKAPAGWDVDQFGSDLQSGDVGNLNFLEPDQCDDIHGTGITGKINGTGATGTASDCDGADKNIYRGDIYTDSVIRKIQASPIWQNQNKRVAIVIMFDEASDSLSSSGFNSCCGWNPITKPGRTGNGTVQGPLVQNDNGDVVIDTTVRNYPAGNKGHGVSIFGVITNQPAAPKGIVDSDAYSHISFVRTLQDMFGLSDPGDDFTYMNRSKYTERFIQQHLSLLPEYLGSADTHFDSVRPMNHTYVIPPGYVQKAQAGELGARNPVQTGPDSNQLNVWALKN